MAERAAYLASLDGAAAGQNSNAAVAAAKDPASDLDEKNGSTDSSVEHLPSQQQQPKDQQQPRNLSRLQRAFYGLPPGSAGATYWQARAPRFRPTMLQQMIRSLLYALQFTGAYIVMLIAMTFNGFIILSIILGGLFGHFVSTWDALAFDLSDADEDPYLLATGGGGSQQQKYITANGRRTLAAGQAAGSSYHASGACCG
jgi:Ctr copper transporter family